MKKSVLLFFAIIMVAVSVFITSCSKDDNDEVQTEKYPSNNNEVSIDNAVIIPPTITYPTNFGTMETNDVSTITYDKPQTDNSEISFWFEGREYSTDGGSTWNLVPSHFNTDEQVMIRVAYSYTVGTEKKYVYSDPISCYTGFYDSFAFAVTDYTENSITVKALNPMPYDYCEITLCNPNIEWENETLRRVSKFNYTEIGDPIKIDVNGYTFSGLEPQQKYAVKYRYVKDNKTTIEGYYHTMTIDQNEFVCDGLFNKIRIGKIDGKSWIILSRNSIWKDDNSKNGFCYNCDGKMACDFRMLNLPDAKSNPIRHFAYGFDVATNDDWKSLFNYLGGTDFTNSKSLYAKDQGSFISVVDENHHLAIEYVQGTDEYGFGLVVGEEILCKNEKELARYTAINEGLLFSDNNSVTNELLPFFSISYIKK